MQPRRLLLIATLTAEIGIVGFTGCRSGASLSRSELAPEPAPASQLPQTEPRARLQFTNQEAPSGPTNPSLAPWTFGDRHDSHTRNSGCSCSSCQGPDPNPLSRPLSLFGVHSQGSHSSQHESDSRKTDSAISQVSYRQETPAADDPALPCPPWDGNAPGATWQFPTWQDATGGAFAPADEFIFDGGDDGYQVAIDRDFNVRGLDPEETVGHFDTLDGRRLVVPSNRVPIYAPRFGSIRKVYGIAGNEAAQALAGVESETGPSGVEDVSIADTTLQQLQPRGQVGRIASSTYRDRTRGMGLENEVRGAEFDNRFSSFEDLGFVRSGAFDQNDKARLAEGLDAAAAWSNQDSPGDVIESLAATGVGTGVPAGETSAVEKDETKPKLRIVKLASRSDARPGEIVEFTIRFDNTGDETLGNVTIIDHLSPRLELIDGSPQCSIKADFFLTLQEETTQIFRAEIVEPLPSGQGGIVRFRCRVR